MFTVRRCCPSASPDCRSPGGAHPPQGEEAEADFDAAAEAEAAARRLREADVVLTSFDVLRAEVGRAGGAAAGHFDHQPLSSTGVLQVVRPLPGLAAKPAHSLPVPAALTLPPLPTALQPPACPRPAPQPGQVYFVPSARSLRRPKKYAVPHCPLLQVGQCARVASLGCLCVACCRGACCRLIAPVSMAATHCCCLSPVLGHFPPAAASIG